MKAELVPSNGDPPIPITRDVTVVGRREFCDVVIDEPSLSKRHCVLVRTDGLLLVRDLVSTNGTKVNGQRVIWAALLPNDRLQLGRYKMRVYLGPDDAPSPSELAAQKGLLPSVVAAPVAIGKAPPPAAGFAAPSTPEGPMPIPSAIIDEDAEDEILDADDLLIDDEDDDEPIAFNLD
ncbi:MAG: FHA domain-containing protein [Isosphaeraceae bacterium]|nr:FHA domain-containing protein [Isosphaeraceae bacterium]